MKLDWKRSVNWFLSFVLISSGLLLCGTFIGCGGDDDDDDDDGKKESNTGGSDDTDTGGTGGKSDEEEPTGGEEPTAGEESNGGAGGSEDTEITAEQKQAVCQCWFDVVDIDIPELGQQCEEMITDSCVTCTEEITDGASCSDMDASELSSCLDECLHLISEPDSSESCTDLVTAATSDPAAVSAGTCMCENCFDVYAPCMANSACLRVILCVAEQGCSGAGCITDPVCSSVITDAMNADSSLGQALTEDISTCSDENKCQEQE